MTKMQVAEAQLEQAVELFGRRDYVSALTLAGAAEEILGRMAHASRGFTALDMDEHFLRGVYEDVGHQPPSRKQVVDDANRVRNHLKHGSGSADEMVKADFKFEAQLMIDRAINNYLIGQGEQPASEQVRDYIKWYWT